MLFSQGRLGSGGVGGLLFIFDHHWYKFLAGIGPTTNNLVELSSIMMVLKLAISKGVSFKHIFGDSLLVVDWLNEERYPKNIFLKPLFQETYRLLVVFDDVSLQHF